MSPQRVLITRRVPPPAVQRLRAAGVQVEELPSDAPPPRALLLEKVAGCAGAITLLSDRVDAEFLRAAGASLRVVANYAVGFDNIDLDACRAQGVRVTNTPGVLTEATADLAWALLLGAARHVGAGERIMRTGNWMGWAPKELLGLELHGATLGVVGAGRIGTAVARRSVGFGMRVLYAAHRENAQLERDLKATRVPLPQLLEQSDVVSLHVPMRPENHHLIGRTELARMKPTAILINTARGPIVDELALVEALREKRIAAAGLDVYEHEPRVSPGLLDLGNVVLLPHLGSATHATRENMSRMAAENVLAVLRSEDPLNPIC